MAEPQRFTAQQLADAVTSLQQDRNKAHALLEEVADSVLDTAPDGLSVAYIRAETLADIRRRVSN